GSAKQALAAGRVEGCPRRACRAAAAPSRLEQERGPNLQRDQEERPEVSGQHGVDPRGSRPLMRVVDASVVVKWHIDEEDSEAAQSVRRSSTSFAVPDLL